MARRHRPGLRWPGVVPRGRASGGRLQLARPRGGGPRARRGGGEGLEIWLRLALRSALGDGTRSPVIPVEVVPNQAGGDTYLARGASKLLRLGEDDVLVIDMSDGSVKAGRTDPTEVLAYLKKGVRVFSVENLHAKVFVLGKTVVVGSANVSRHSRDVLEEAGIETTDPKVRAKVIAWIESLAIAPVGPKLAAAKAKLYKPPAWGGAKDGRKLRGQHERVVRGELGVL